MLIVLFVVLFVVESFFELIITLRAASGFVPSSSIRRCPSGSSSSSQGASCVFMFLMVGSMIVVSFFELIITLRQQQQQSRRFLRLHVPRGRQHDRFQPGLRG